jgi:hypothetical protein
MHHAAPSPVAENLPPTDRGCDAPWPNSLISILTRANVIYCSYTRSDELTPLVRVVLCAHSFEVVSMFI